MMPALRIGPLQLQTPLLLAPMAGYSDTAFRTGIRSLGAVGLAFTEMANPHSVLGGGGRKREALLARHPGDAPLGWQIYGTDPGLLAECAQYLCAERQAELIDINMGCPQRKIAGRGEGAGLLKTPGLARKIAAAVVAAVPVPVMVKLRIGWDQPQRIAPELAATLADAGVAAITLHGRTAVQKYTGKADWSAIREVVSAADGVPVIGNGDVTTPQEAQQLLESTGCAGVMIGRAALRNPWIFHQIRAWLADGEPTPIVSRQERLEFLLSHLDRLSALYGEHVAAKLFRKWIPLHAKALGISKRIMVQLLHMDETSVLRTSLQQSVATGDQPATGEAGHDGKTQDDHR